MFCEDEKRYKVLEQILNNVNNSIVKMDENYKKECVRISMDVINIIINMLKTDEAFSKLYSRLTYVGSYFDGLRVKEATEFDINIIMKLPVKYDQIKIENTNVPAGYVKLNISEAIDPANCTGEVKKILNKCTNSAGFLLQNEFRHWLESVFTKKLGKIYFIDYDNKKLKVQLKKSGPAFTLLIFIDEYKRIDVDLVCTFEFSQTPPSSIRTSDNSGGDPWVVVPKPLDPNIPGTDIFWRASFPTAEQKLIENFNKLKFVNRLLKALRDNHQSNLPIASYYIKTVFLWEAHYIKVNRNIKFWEKNLGYLFVYSLNKLHQYLSDRKLSYYWHKKMNLFQQFNKSHTENMAGYIKSILKKIELLLDESQKTRSSSELSKYIFSLFKIIGIGELNIHELHSPELSGTQELNEPKNSSCTIL